jgi:alanine racemase
MGLHRRTWAEIDLNALAANVAAVRRITPGKEIIAVVKANAYGHGDDIICTELHKLGINFFAVSCIDEALQIKKYVSDSEILVFGFAEAESFKSAAENNFILSVGSAEYARELSSQGLHTRVHIKVNTGMNRVGINTEAELDEVLALPGLRCEAVYTHFACADSPDEDDMLFTQGQQEKLLSSARSRGLKIHSQNSGGVLLHGGFDADYVRVGLALYGLSPDINCKSPIELTPVLSLKSAIHQLRTLEAGDYVSYGRTFRASEKRLAAVVPAGYADGFSRANSNNGSVIIKGTLCPVIGRVCMDQTVIDVSQVADVRIGDEVLFYSAGHKETSIEYIAEKLGTIPYEVVCAVSQRVRRVPV